MGASDDRPMIQRLACSGKVVLPEVARAHAVPHVTLAEALGRP
jgi:hypothetical protein